MNYKDKKVGVLMGGMSAEREISLKSGRACLEALIAKGYHAVPVEAGKDLPHRIRDEKIEVAFIALHGRYGEDGTVQGMLELMGIPYTGSGVLASAIAINKAFTKDILIANRMNTPRYIAVKKGDAANIDDMRLPVVVKPASEGSTLGISIVRDKEDIQHALNEAFKFDRNVIIEEFVSGKEITVGVLDGTPLPAVEVRPASGFYDYNSKYTPGMTEYMCPAEITEEFESRSRQTAMSVYNCLGCSGAARVDIIINESGPQVIEINTIPGMTETSLLPKAAARAGINFHDLVERILEGAGLKI